MVKVRLVRLLEPSFRRYWVLYVPLDDEWCKQKLYIGMKSDELCN